MVRPGARSQHHRIGTRSKSPPPSASASAATCGGGEDEPPPAGDQPSAAGSTTAEDHQVQRTTEGGNDDAKGDEDTEEMEQDEEDASTLATDADKEDEADPMIDESERSGLGDSQRSARSGGATRGRRPAASMNSKPAAVTRVARGRRTQAKPPKTRGAAKPAPGPPPRKKRGPGRPRRAVAASEDSSDGDDGDESASPAPPKRRPGRPRKLVVAEEENADDQGDGDEEETTRRTPLKRRPGRPRIAAVPEDPTEIPNNDEGAEKQGDEATVDATCGDDGEATGRAPLKRRPGRPRKVAVAEDPSKNRNDEEDAEEQGDEATVDVASVDDGHEAAARAPLKRRPGRPRKVAIPADPSKNPDNEEDTEEQGNEEMVDAASGDDDHEAATRAPLKWRPGRPRKVAVQEDPSENPGDEEGTEEQGDEAMVDAASGDDGHEAAARAPLKRRPGRPRKVAVPEDPSENPDEEDAEEQGDEAKVDAASGDDDYEADSRAPLKRRPGRPRKVAITEDPSDNPDEEEDAGEQGDKVTVDVAGGDDDDEAATRAPRKRRPGRPRKVPVTVDGIGEDPEQEHNTDSRGDEVAQDGAGADNAESVASAPRKRRGGRPRKTPVAADAADLQGGRAADRDANASVDVVPRNRRGGRPRKAPEEQTYKNATKTAGGDEDEPPARRKRGPGRPRRAAVASAETEDQDDGAVADAEAEPLAPRKRGRPGRPRKAPLAVDGAEDQGAPNTAGGDDDDELSPPRKRGRPGRPRRAPVPGDPADDQGGSDTASGDDDEVPAPRKRGRRGRPRAAPVAVAASGQSHDGEEKTGEPKDTEKEQSPLDGGRKLQESQNDTVPVDATSGDDEDDIGSALPRNRRGKPQKVLADEFAGEDGNVEAPKDSETRLLPPEEHSRLPGNQDNRAVMNIPSAGDEAGHAPSPDEPVVDRTPGNQSVGIDVIAKLVPNEEFKGGNFGDRDGDGSQDRPSRLDRRNDDDAILVERSLVDTDEVKPKGQTAVDNACLKSNRPAPGYSSSVEKHKGGAVSESDTKAQESVHDRDKMPSTLENEFDDSARPEASSFVESSDPVQLIETSRELEEGTTDRDVDGGAVSAATKLTMESKIPRKTSRLYSSASAETTSYIEDANRQHQAQADVEATGEEFSKSDGSKSPGRDEQSKPGNDVDRTTNAMIAIETVDSLVSRDDMVGHDVRRAESSAVFPVSSPRVDVSQRERLSDNEMSQEDLLIELDARVETDGLVESSRRQAQDSTLERPRTDIQSDPSPSVDTDTHKGTKNLPPSDPLDRWESPKGDLRPTIDLGGVGQQETAVFERPASGVEKPSAHAESLAVDECIDLGKEEKGKVSREESTREVLSIADRAETNDGAAKETCKPVEESSVVDGNTALTTAVITAQNSLRVNERGSSLFGSREPSEQEKNIDAVLRVSTKSPGAEDAGALTVNPGTVDSSPPSSSVRTMSATSNERALTTDARRSPLQEYDSTVGDDRLSSSQLAIASLAQITKAATAPVSQTASSPVKDVFDVEMPDASDKADGESTKLQRKSVSRASIPLGDDSMVDEDTSELGQAGKRRDLPDNASSPMQEREPARSSPEADPIEIVASTSLLHDDATSDFAEVSSLSDALPSSRPIPAFRVSTPRQFVATSETTATKLSLHRIKLALFSLGRRIHGRIGYERMFSQYWSAFSIVLHGAGVLEKTLWKHRAFVESFLKTRKMRSLHNKLVLGLLDRCYRGQLPGAYEDSCHNGNEDKIVRLESYPQKAESKETPIKGPGAPSLTRLCPPYYPLVSGPTPKPPVLKSYPVKTSFRIPGAMAIDPYVREVASTAGMSMSENAIWLLVLAMKEFAQTALRNCVQMKSAIEGGDVPPMPLIRQRVVHRKRDIGNHSGECISRKTLEPNAQACITSLDVFTLVSSMSIGGARAIGGTISRTAFERSLSSSHEASIEPRPAGFDELKDFITSKISPPLQMKVKYEESMPNKSLDSSAVTTSSAVPMASSKPRTIQGGGGLGRGAKDLGALRARSITQRNAAAAAVSATTATATPEAAVNASSDSIYAPQDCGPSTVSPLTRAESTSDPGTAPKGSSQPLSLPPTEPAPPSPTESDTQTINVVRRGKGFGVKNLAAMRARSITKHPDAEEEKQQAEGSSTMSSDPVSSSSTSAAPLASS